MGYRLYVRGFNNTTHKSEEECFGKLFGYADPDKCRSFKYLTDVLGLSDEQIDDLENRFYSGLTVNIGDITTDKMKDFTYLYLADKTYLNEYPYSAKGGLCLLKFVSEYEIFDLTWEP